MKTKFLSIALCIVVLITAVSVLVACNVSIKEPITFSDASFMYDGSEHIIEVTGAPKDASVSYSPSNVQKEIGTYEITAIVTVDGEIISTLKATMTIGYKITYVLNEGSLPEDSADIYTGESDFILPQPQRASYLFDGWYESEALTGEKVDSLPTGSSGNKTYYAKWVSATVGITYALSADGKYYTVTGYEGEDTNVLIPDLVDGIPVTSVAKAAFRGKLWVTSITVPDSVTSI
ncbi:MAG: InlB B-repeat-containing protein, partial [Clostridia bacterium]|nr:InlB B-repeat-containing protein [Clostridia bacterium]